MTSTPHLGLPLLAAAQAQKHVTHNEALLAIDALLQCAVFDKDLAQPPTNPATGDRYLVAPGATGSWAGQAGSLATWQDGVWDFYLPQTGFLVFVTDESQFYVSAASGWVPLTSAFGAVQNLTRLGIGTNADATNPVSAKINKALWAARTVGEGGSGDLRYTMNKEAAGNVASLLFQTGFSGRAEIGLTGDDDLHVKVSADGTSFTEAIRIDRATGAIALKAATLGGPIRPSGDAGSTLGTASFRWGQIYSSQSAISTSDGREKASLEGTPTGMIDWRVTALSTAEIAWAKSLAAAIGLYAWRSRIDDEGLDAARHHCGLTVQRALALAAQCGITDPMRYGFVCHDRWDETPDQPAGERYGFRYEQLAMFIAAGQEARLAALEDARAA